MKVVCSVFDTKAQIWSTPFYSHSRATAMRDFSAAAKGGTGIAQFPADYELWVIGEWHEETGVLVPSSHHEYLAKGSDFVEEV